MLLKPGHDVAFIRRAIVEAAGFGLLLVALGCLLFRTPEEIIGLVLGCMPLLLFYWLARWRGVAGLVGALVVLPILAAFVLVGGALSAASPNMLIIPFLPLAAVVAAFIAESRFAR